MLRHCSFRPAEAADAAKLPRFFPGTGVGPSSAATAEEPFCVLLSAETACSPDASIAHLFPRTGTPYRYPNAGATWWCYPPRAFNSLWFPSLCAAHAAERRAFPFPASSASPSETRNYGHLLPPAASSVSHGTIMGHVGAFRRLLGAHLAAFRVPMDDQAWWQARYLSDRAATAAGAVGAGGEGNAAGVRVLLDSSARVFQCLWGAQDHLERGEGMEWRNVHTGCVLVLGTASSLTEPEEQEKAAAGDAEKSFERKQCRPGRRLVTPRCGGTSTESAPCCLLPRSRQDVPDCVSRQWRPERLFSRGATTAQLLLHFSMCFVNSRRGAAPLTTSTYRTCCALAARGGPYAGALAQRDATIWLSSLRLPQVIESPPTPPAAPTGGAAGRNGGGQAKA